jgi:hypothetical protein
MILLCFRTSLRGTKQSHLNNAVEIASSLRFPRNDEPTKLRLRQEYPTLRQELKNHYEHQADLRRYS